MADESWAVRTPEAARMLGVSRQTVVNMVDRDELRAHYTQGGHRRVDRKSVEDLLDVLRIPPGADRVTALADLVERNRRLRNAVE